MSEYTLQLVISPVKNGFIIQKGDETYIALTEDGVVALLHALLHKDDLPDIPF